MASLLLNFLRKKNRTDFLGAGPWVLDSADSMIFFVESDSLGIKDSAVDSLIPKESRNPRNPLIPRIPGI